MEDKENAEEAGKKGRRVSVGDHPPINPIIPKKKNKESADGNHPVKPPLVKDLGKQGKVLSEKQNNMSARGKADYVRNVNEKGAKGGRP